MAESVAVLVVGLPGAGKTVLIDRAAKSSDWRVLDPDRFRRRMSPVLRRLPIPYPLYVLAMVVAIGRDTHVVAESRGTYAWLRRLFTVCARSRGRDAVIVLLVTSPQDAMAGQVRRGRVAPKGVMRWNTDHWGQLLASARSGALASEGWTRILVLDRAQASGVQDFDELVRESSAVRRDESPDADARVSG